MSIELSAIPEYHCASLHCISHWICSAKCQWKYLLKCVVDCDIQSGVQYSQVEDLCLGILWRLLPPASYVGEAYRFPPLPSKGTPLSGPDCTCDTPGDLLYTVYMSCGFRKISKGRVYGPWTVSNTLFQITLFQISQNILSQTLCINLNIDGTPIVSRSLTHPSHSQTSRLLSPSLSLGLPFPHHPVCVRFWDPSVSSFSLS